MKFRGAVLIFVCAFAGSGLFAQDVDIPFQKFVLDNGLTVVVHEDHKAPIVAVNLWYHVGSKNEKPGKTGFAHLFEHLMFGGSEHAKGRYIDAMEKIGATDLNGTTNNDRTNYFENVPTSALDYTLWMESDRMGFLLGQLDQKTLDLQRGVVQNEKRQGENQPYAVSFQLITQNTYPAGHPYSWTVIGEMADLNAASMDDVKEWFKTYYGPSNVVICLAGDIDAKTAKEKVEKYFGNIPAGPPVGHQEVWIAKMTGTHRGVVQDRVPQARIYKAWNVPPDATPDGDYLALVSNVLSSGKSSRFYKRLVYDDQIATDANAFVALNEIAGQLRIQATANGLKVILAERHEVPLVTLWLDVDAGYAADPAGQPGTSSMAMSLLSGGTKTRNALQISDEQALLGAQIAAFSNLDTSIVRLSALKSKLDPSLELYSDLILNPVFPEDDFKKQQTLQKAAIQREQTTPIQMALRVFPGLLYGPGHAYGNPLTGSGTIASVEKMTRDDLAKFHQTWFKPNHATLVISGDTTLTEITPKLEKLLSAWKPGQTPGKNVKPVQLPTKSIVYMMDKPDAQQSIIMVGNIAPPTANPNEIAIEAMNDGLGGLFLSRINANLRENKHWSYGTTSLLWGARGQRPWLTLAPVQTDKTKESLEEINKELRGIVGDHPLTQEELSVVQDNETFSLPGSRETQQEVGNSINELVQFGLPDDYYETMAAKIRALKPADVEAAAKIVDHPDNLIWVVVGDRSKIEAGVKELNLGELRFLGPDGKPL